MSDEKNKKKIRVGITQGDINGIGIEVILKALAAPEICELCQPIVYGSSKILGVHRRAMEMPAVQMNYTRNATYVKENMPNLVECVNEEIKVEPGQLDKQAGRAAFLALEAAVADLKEGDIDVLVTGPINKANIQSAQFNFPGHTEYLQSATASDGEQAMMMMCHDSLRVAFVTHHVPLSQVPELITPQLLGERLRTLDTTLRRDFLIERPRIAVLALNPHTGENGLMGTTERDIITPAMEAAQDGEGILCFGPFAADSFFGMRKWEHFDAVLAMHYDQGAVPFKAMAMLDGALFTAGLPVVRTAPAHGTAYDIAGQGVANEQSLRSAIYLAIDVLRNRRTYDEAHAHPLKKLYVDRGKDNVVLDLTKTEEPEL